MRTQYCISLPDFFHLIKCLSGKHTLLPTELPPQLSVYMFSIQYWLMDMQVSYIPWLRWIMLQKTCTVDYFLDPLILNFLYMCLEARLLDYTVILFLALRFIFFFCMLEIKPQPVCQVSSLAHRLCSPLWIHYFTFPSTVDNSFFSTSCPHYLLSFW